MSLQRYLGEIREVIASDELCLACAKEAEDLARYIAGNLDKRHEIVASQESIWDSLGDYWVDLAQSFHPTGISVFEVASEDSRKSLVLALGKLERNLVAGLPEHQSIAISHEPAIRQLIFNLTTFARIEDPTFFTLHSVLTQLLLNIICQVSADDDSTRPDRVLEVYLSGKREDDVIIRLLDSQDVKTNQATLHLINNLTRNNVERQNQCLREVGVRWFGRILSRIDGWHETEDGRFEISVEIFTSYIASGLHGTLYDKLGDEAEPITPSQTSLLKLIDSYLSSNRENESPSPHSFLVRLFKDYSRYALISLGSGKDDARLPKIFEGMVLISESFVSISLSAQKRKDQKESGGGDEEIVLLLRTHSIIKSAIDLLSALNKLIPRVKPGVETLSPEQAAPVTLLKRLLVQLVAILTFDDTVTGDIVRECGGVQLILGLTEVDESNPYLREHALLAIRNLMLNNPANQAIITQMDPVGIISEQGEVLPLPDKMKR